jgi:hypothetical protein
MPEVLVEGERLSLRAGRLDRLPSVADDDDVEAHPGLCEHAARCRHRRSSGRRSLREHHHPDGGIVQSSPDGRLRHAMSAPDEDAMIATKRPSEGEGRAEPVRCSSARSATSPRPTKRPDDGGQEGEDGEFDRVVQAVEWHEAGRSAKLRDHPLARLGFALAVSSASPGRHVARATWTMSLSALLSMMSTARAKAEGGPEEIVWRVERVACRANAHHDRDERFGRVVTDFVEEDPGR